MNPGGTEEIIKEKMTEAMANYGNPGSEGVTRTWNFAQQTLQCCGVKGEVDWTDQGKSKGKDSCWKDADCRDNFANCTKGMLIQLDIWQHFVGLEIL